MNLLVAKCSCIGKRLAIDNMFVRVDFAYSIKYISKTLDIVRKTISLNEKKRKAYICIQKCVWN
jgi:hypothetical protein